MKLTPLIRELETKLRSAEKLAASYDARAQSLRKKLSSVAQIIGSPSKFEARPLSAPSRRQNLRRGPGSEGRARIAEAQRKRWIAYRASKGEIPPSSPAAKESASRMSAAGRARIAEAQRKRWAAFRKKKK